jgi:hypothetical protein
MIYSTVVRVAASVCTLYLPALASSFGRSSRNVSRTSVRNFGIPYSTTSRTSPARKQIMCYKLDSSGARRAESKCSNSRSGLAGHIREDLKLLGLR